MYTQLKEDVEKNETNRKKISCLNIKKSYNLIKQLDLKTFLLRLRK